MFLSRMWPTKFRDQLRPFHFDPTKYETYLDQLGIQYPMTVKPAATP